MLLLALDTTDIYSFMKFVCLLVPMTPYLLPTLSIHSRYSLPRNIFQTAGVSPRVPPLAFFSSLLTLCVLLNQSSLTCWWFLQLQFFPWPLHWVSYLYIHLPAGHLHLDASPALRLKMFKTELISPNTSNPLIPSLASFLMTAWVNPNPKHRPLSY